jgi:hypothetical protein
MALVNATGSWTGAAYQSTANFNAGEKGELDLPGRDREILRELAAQVAEEAALPAQREKRELWRRHNDLEATRPVVLCDPENGWNEIITTGGLACGGTLARRWEMVLRKELFWSREMKDDKVIEAFFEIGITHSEDDWGVQARQRGGEGGAYVWEPALHDESEIDKLHPPRFEMDEETTAGTVALAWEIFGGLLAVRRVGVWWWSLGLTLDLSLWRGLEGIMMDMIERPQVIHRLMSLLRDGTLQKLDRLQERGLLSLNSEQYVGSGGFGYTSQLPSGVPLAPVRTDEMWGFCESQETVGVSPEMFAEFIFPYQLPLLERFGLNCYGCCEPLDVRWSVVRQAPNLRRVSVSSWANVKKMAAALEDRYVFSWKPSPAPLASPRLDERTVRAALRETLDATRGCRLEIIMKDNHTLGGNPHNAVRWVEIAREEIERAVGR